MPETNFFWDPLSDNILQERDETGAVTAEYTTEPGLYGNLISQSRQGVESQYHFDAIGSTFALTDDTQHVTDTNAYTAFGEVTEHAGSKVNPFQYCAQKEYFTYDGLDECLARRRLLSRRRGHWLSFDPVDDHIRSPFMDVNTYLYVLNNPVLYRDASGFRVTPPPTPRAPGQPWITITRDLCRTRIDNFFILIEERRGKGKWIPISEVVADARGFFPNECRRRKTYTIDFTFSEHVKALGFPGGGPPADVFYPDLFRKLTFRPIKGMTDCTMAPTVINILPPDAYATVKYDCSSPCDECKKRCLSESGELWIGVGHAQAPLIVVKWEFTPTRLDDDCGYDECDMNLSMTQS